MKNVFDPNDVAEIISRIEKLTTETQPLWGKMNVSQMLGHCNVTYEMAFETIHPKPGSIKRFILKLLVKPGVVNEKPYPKNSPTAPQFKGMGERDFATEKGRLIAYINKTLELGADHFEGRESHSFGPITSLEWNNSLYKHLDHHLQQFGV